MQSNSRKYIMSGTPRVEMVQYGTIYSNLGRLGYGYYVYLKEKDTHRFHVNTHLVDADQQTPIQGAIPVTLDYVYSQQACR